MPTGTPPAPLENSVRVAFEGNYLGTSWAVVHWFMIVPATGPPTSAQVDDLGAAIDDAFHGNLMNAYCQNDVHLTTTVVSYYLGGEERIRRIRVGDAVGDAGGSALPAQVSTMINWSTTDARRGGKPRTFMPGASTANVTESYATAAGALVGLTNAANTYVDDVNSIASSWIASCTFVEMSFVTNKAYRLTPEFFPIDGGSPRVIVATQRRRVDRQAP